jgi:hypothetical protein
LSHPEPENLLRIIFDFADPMAVPELVYPENFYAAAEAGIFYAALPQA